VEGQNSNPYESAQNTSEGVRHGCQKIKVFDFFSENFFSLMSKLESEARTRMRGKSKRRTFPQQVASFKLINIIIMIKKLIFLPTNSDKNAIK